MKIKSLVAASVFAIASVGSFAAVGTLGDLNAGEITFSTKHTGSFTDLWNFDLSLPSEVGATVTNIHFSSTRGVISSFEALLDGTALNLTSLPGFSYLDSSAILSRGTHKLTVNGFANTASSYGVYMSAAPVPEPETYGMLLVGLGLMGAVVRRRNKSDSEQA